MAHDYLAIPATTCLAECSFSMSAHTDDPQQGHMQKLKFGGLQKLCAGCLDGQIDVDSEIVKKYIADFDFNEDDYSVLYSMILLFKILCGNPAGPGIGLGWTWTGPHGPGPAEFRARATLLMDQTSGARFRSREITLDLAWTCPWMV